jgi:hypothetical protein
VEPYLLGTFRYQSITLAGRPVPHSDIIPECNSETQSKGNAFRVYQIQIPIASNCHETKYQTDDADREMNTPQIM